MDVSAASAFELLDEIAEVGYRYAVRELERMRREKAPAFLLQLGL